MFMSKIVDHLVCHP